MNHPTRRSSGASLPRSISAELEPLEQRRLLAAGGLWLYAAGSANDTITLRVHPQSALKLQLVVNGSPVGTRLASAVKLVRIDGGGGNDKIVSDLGPDLDRVRVDLDGGRGDDTLEGGCGDDELDGGKGNDLLRGEMGDDDLRGGPGDDALAGNEGKDALNGGLGKDSVSGGMGEDSMHGGDGSDQLAGGYDIDIVRGGEGNDTVRGGQGADVLFGGVGRDVLYNLEEDTLRNVLGDKTFTDKAGNTLSKIKDPAALKAWIIDAAIKRWGPFFGKRSHPWWGKPGMPIFSRGSVFTTDGVAANLDAGAPSAPNSSNTNTQESNVDEADLVETDGQHLYVVSGGNLVIIDAWPAENAREVARVPLTGSVHGIYLHNGRLTVVSSNTPRWWAIDMEARLMPGNFLPTKPQAHLTVIDVKTPASPKVIEKTTLDGSISASRMIGSQLYLVMDSQMKVPDPLLVAGDGKNDKPGDKYYESEAAYRARLEAMSLSAFLPSFSSTLNGNSGPTGPLVGDEILAPDSDIDLSSLFSVIRMDMSDNHAGPDDTTTVAGFSGEVYATSTSLYVASQGYDSPMGDVFESRTDLYKFSLGQEIGFEGAGHVPGYLVNRYAMSEHEGSLRLATTTTAGGFSNNIFVMQDKGESLETVGSIQGLALSERIYAARFVGERGYLVTFRQIDPLFTLDLADPAKPRVAGELKVPGFSTYLHPISLSRLMGFGREVNDNGQLGALRLSVFDVTDMSDPLLKTWYSIPSQTPGGYVSSLAEQDPHAFAWFADWELAAIPVQDSWSKNYLEVLHVEEGLGIRQMMRIQHQGRVLRAVNIGEYIYSIGTDAVKVVPIGSNEPVASITLGGQDSGGGIIVF